MIKLYTEKKMISPCFFKKKGGFLTSNSPRFPAKGGLNRRKTKWKGG